MLPWCLTRLHISATELLTLASFGQFRNLFPPKNQFRGKMILGPMLHDHLVRRSFFHEIVGSGLCFHEKSSKCSTQDQFQPNLALGYYYHRCIIIGVCSGRVGKAISVIQSSDQGYTPIMSLTVDRDNGDVFVCDCMTYRI